MFIDIEHISRYRSSVHPRSNRMHYFLRSSDILPRPAYVDNSRAFCRYPLVDGTVGSVHMGLGRCELGAGGHVDSHVHSFEESFFVLEGTPTLVLDGRAYPLVPGACGVVPVSVPHAWLGPSSGRATWIDMLAPQPRAGGMADDTFFVGPPLREEIREFDIRDPRSRHLFRLDDADIELERLKMGSRVDAPTVSANMATALLAYSGARSRCSSISDSTRSYRRCSWSNISLGEWHIPTTIPLRSRISSSRATWRLSPMVGGTSLARAICSGPASGVFTPSTTKPTAGCVGWRRRPHNHLRGIHIDSVAIGSTSRTSSRPRHGPWRVTQLHGVRPANNPPNRQRRSTARAAFHDSPCLMIG